MIFKTEVIDKPKSLNIVISGDVIARGARTMRIAKVNWDILPKLINLMGENGHFINAEISHFHPEPLQTAREKLDKMLNKDFAILSKMHIVGGGSGGSKLEEVKQSEDGVTDILVNNVETLFNT